MRKLFLFAVLFTALFAVLDSSAQRLEWYVGEYSYTGNEFAKSGENPSVGSHLEIVDMGGGAIEVLWGKYTTTNLYYEDDSWGYTRDKSTYSISAAKTSATTLEITIMKPSPDIPSNTKEVVLVSKFRKNK